MKAEHQKSMTNLRAQEYLQPFHWSMMVKTGMQFNLTCSGPKEIASDYVDPSNIKIKKPKKKKPKNTTRLTTLIDDEGLRGIGVSVDNVDGGDALPIAMSSNKRARNDDSGLGDDEELQEILAKRRHQALKKRKLGRPEDFVWNIRQYADEDDILSIGNGGLVIDDTSEFVRGLEMSQLEEGAAPSESFHGEEKGEEINANAAGTNDIEMPDENFEPSDSVIQSGENMPSTVLDDEPLITGSIAATLAALRRTGICPLCLRSNHAFPGEIGQENSTSNFTMEELAKREEILARQRLRNIQREADARRQRELERQSERFNRMSQRDREQYREQENQAREQNESQQRMREFEDFKFNVGLEYKDEFGQEMSKKDVQAFVINF